MIFMGRKIKGNKKISRKKRIKKSKIELQRPKGIRIINDGKTIVFEENETFDSNLRKSFRELTKDDSAGFREWSASFDFEDGTTTLKDVDIARGKTADETKRGRASVRTRIDEKDEFAIHNHPIGFGTNFRGIWNRPSGGDIGNFIWRSNEFPNYNMKSAYIMQDDGRLIRYSLIDKDRAFSMADQAQRDFDFKLPAKEKKKWHGAVDWKIETKVIEIRSEVTSLAERDEIINKKFEERNDKLAAEFLKRDKRLEKKQDDLIPKLFGKGLINQREFFKDNPIIKKRFDSLGEQRDVLIDDFNQESDELGEKFLFKKNPKFIKQRKNEEITKFQRRKGLLIERRFFKEFTNYLKDEWGMDVRRMPKEFKSDLLITQKGEKIEVDIIPN